MTRLNYTIKVKHRLLFYSSMLFLIVACASQDRITPFEFQTDTYVTEIQRGNNIAKVSAFYFTPEDKLLLRKKYHWLVQDTIIETNANYSGKLLHGPYEEFYESGQLAIKGLFNYGLKTGKWFHWSEKGEQLYTQRWTRGKAGKLKLPKFVEDVGTAKNEQMEEGGIENVDSVVVE